MLSGGQLKVCPNFYAKIVMELPEFNVFYDKSA
jgi:hypothetical protein